MKQTEPTVTCVQCRGTGWQEMAPYDDGSKCEEICSHCQGYGHRVRTPEEEATRRAWLKEAGRVNDELLSKFSSGALAVASGFVTTKGRKKGTK